MSYKMIAIDLDGTLLTDSKKVTEENRRILRAISKKGIEIVIATGRRYISAKNFIKDLELENLTILANNGNIIRKSKDDSLIKANHIDELDFYNLVEVMKSHDLTPIVHVNKLEEGFDLVGEFDFLDKRYNGYLTKQDDTYRKVSDLLRFKDPKALALVYPEEGEKLLKLKYKIETVFPNKFNVYFMDKLIGVSPILEIISKDVSKWKAIEEYSKNMGIKKEEIITIGDDTNDLDMIINSGLGISMKNGSKAILEAADIITKKDNNNSGLGRQLLEIFEI